MPFRGIRRHERADTPPRARCFAFLLIVATGLFPACASVPRGRAAVGALRITGMRSMDERALLACLATRSRANFTFDLSTNPNPACGVPPFDAGHLRWEVFAFPWTEYPLYDRTVFERDVERIERWYQARGYYEASVVSAETTPDPEETAARSGEVAIAVRVDEGQPIHVARVALAISRPRDQAPPDDVLRRDLQNIARRLYGRRFDEADYDVVKTALLERVREASYARATVHGAVAIDPEGHTADVALTIALSSACHFGAISVRVEGEDIPASSIQEASLLQRGAPYRQSAILEGQRLVYGLGAFTSVEVAPDLSGDRTEIPVSIVARTGRMIRAGVGVGIQIGQAINTTSTNSLSASSAGNPADVHVLGFFEHRNLFGGLRRFRAELRPRLVFTPELTNVNRVAPGLVAASEFRQPGVIEAATWLLAAIRYDYGPDPFGRSFERHEFDTWIGPERAFLDSKLHVQLALHGTVFAPSPIGIPTTTIPAGFGILYFEERATLDLRDDPYQPRGGFYASLALQEAPFPLPSSWQYLRAVADVRGYIPLPFGVTIGVRGVLGALGVLGASFPSDVDPHVQRLGPDVHRFRGGGANSNRGFYPAQLGGTELRDYGGLRSWEASAEVRFRLTESFGVTLFADTGDVSPNSDFRFDHPHLSLGFGIRYRTLVGPVRADFGFPIPDAQVAGVPGLAGALTSTFYQPFAVHLTIGEAW